MMLKLILVLSLLLISCSSGPFVKIDGDKIDVEVADESVEMIKGLMGREELCEDCGMIFVFQDDREHSFWMKNTLIPLDMIFINSENVVVDVLSAVPCTEDPCPHYKPENKAKYVLEVNSGRFGNIVGETVEIKI